MDDFRIIYKILCILHSNEECEEPDPERLSPKRLGISEAKRDSLLLKLADEGLIKGLDATMYVGSARPEVYISKECMPWLTLKGLEYLKDNSAMKKIAETAKGIIGIIK